MSRAVKERKIESREPVTKIELSDQHSSLRMLIVILLIIIGAIALIHGFTSYTSIDSGWTEIDISALADINSSKEFTLGYELGTSDESAGDEKKKISKISSDALRYAYEVFHSEQEYEGVHNVYYLNQHPNEIVEVDAILYQAFELLESNNNRNMYLAPVYSDYRNLFFCNNDFEIVNYDPYQNEEVKEYFKEILEFAQDESVIRVELLGKNQVRLLVADVYLDYAKEVGFSNYIDFFWMKNAFIVDYLAEKMCEYGYTKGMISSFDGFICNFDDRDLSYSYPLTNRDDKGVYSVGSMQYRSSANIVSLRDYPLSSMDRIHYYGLESGEIRSAYIDVKDGLCKSATKNLVCYAENRSCAEILVQMIPIFIADYLDQEEITHLKEEGIYSVYQEDRDIIYNDPDLNIVSKEKKDSIIYHDKFVK